ncbi:BTAD domain-containing putative transcriptional regulator [Streptomyces sp. CA-106110]|uniref:BTAD domain-containing putative transcriptional regulator n=1 Tax=Streptomyces sp. CA-106110 TaxID=3240044 RepID=UPI003D8DEC75
MAVRRRTAPRRLPTGRTRSGVGRVGRRTLVVGGLPPSADARAAKNRTARPAEALAVHRDLRERLIEELGTDGAAQARAGAGAAGPGRRPSGRAGVRTTAVPRRPSR